MSEYEVEQMAVSICVLSSGLEDLVSIEKERYTRSLANLGETDGGGLFTKTLTAEVKAVFADDTSLVGAQTAEEAHGEQLS